MPNRAKCAKLTVMIRSSKSRIETTTELRGEIDKVIQDFHKEKDQLQKLLGKQQRNIIDTLLAKK